MKGWVTKTIGELCDENGGSVQTGPSGSQLHESDYSETGTPVVMPKDILDGTIDEQSVARVSDDHVFRLRRHKVISGDIVYGRRGDIGRQALMRERHAGRLCGTGCLRIRLGEATLSPKFLHYYLRLGDVIRWIEGQAIGATVPNLNTNILRRLPVTFPIDPLVQNAIAGILSAYDELIRNNKHRTALLERIAEEIYREWFVRLRFPGHQSTKIAKGLPVGWEMLPLSQLVELNPSERLDQSEEYPFVGMEDLSLTSMFFSPSQLRRGGQGAKFRNRDVLLPRITPSVENGKRAFVMTLKDGEVGFGSTEFIVMREKVLRAEHLYFLTCSSELRKHAELSMTGASGRQRVQEECFSFFLVKTPPPELRAQLSLTIGPHFDQIRTLAFQTQILTKVRDLLLPRLMSGKLSVENLDIHFPPGMAEEIDAKPVGTAHA